MKNCKGIIIIGLIWISLFPFLAVGFIELNEGLGYTYETDDFDTTINAINGTETNFTTQYGRLARINLVGLENITSVFNTYSIYTGNTTNTVIKTVDYDKNGNVFSGNVGFTDANASVGWYFENTSIYQNNTQFSSVLNFGSDSVDRWDLWNYGFSWVLTDTSFGSSDYVQIKLFYNNGFKIQCYTFASFTAKYSTQLINTSVIDLKKPFYFYVDMREEDNVRVWYGNTFGTIYKFNVSNVWLGTAYTYHINYNYRNIGNTPYGGYMAVDFNEGYNISNIYNYEHFDNTYYPERCLEIYELNSESYGLNDNNELDIEFENDNYQITSQTQYYRDNTTNSFDYKLDQNGILKTGLKNNINDWNNLTTNPSMFYEANILNHENVLVGYDKSITSRVYIAQSLDENMTDALIEFYIAFNNITDKYGQYTEVIFLDTTDNEIVNMRFNYIDYGKVVNKHNVSQIVATNINENAWHHFQLWFNDTTEKCKIYINGSYASEIDFFHSNPTGIEQVRLRTRIDGKANHYFYLDALNFNSSYIEGSNKWIGTQNQTKSINTIRCETTNLVSDTIVIDTQDTNNLFNLELIDAGLGYRYFNESDYSGIGVIFNDVNVSSQGYLQFEISDGNVWGYDDFDITSHYRIRLYDNGSASFHIYYYSYYTGIINLVWNSGIVNNFHSQQNQTDNRIGIWIQRVEMSSMRISFFNSTYIYTLPEYYGRISFGFDIKLSMHNLYGFNLYGICAKNDNENWYNTFLNSNNPMIINSLLKARNRELIQTKILSSTLTTYTLPVQYYANFQYMYKIGVISYETTDYSESNYEYTGKIYSDYNTSISEFTQSVLEYNDELHTFNYEYNDTSVLSVETVRNNKLYIRYTIVFLTNNIADSIQINTDVRILWYFYYSEKEGGFIERIADIIVPVMILGMFPIALYPKFKIKGAMVGLVGGIIILFISDLLSLRFALIMIPLSLIIMFLTLKDKSKVDYSV